MYLVDSHCHLMALEEETSAVIARAKEAGVKAFINVGAIDGVSAASSAVKTAEKFEEVFATVGIHPHDAGSYTSFMEVEALASHPKVIAIGETGLDFYRDWSPFEGQRLLFESGIRLALRVGKPLVIHCRDALEETLEILARNGAEKVGGVFHCYSGDDAFARKLRELNFFVSFPGALTFKNAHKTQEAAAAIPISQILLETDCPYMAPEPHRGKPSEPAHVRLIAEKLAKLKGITVDEVAQATTENAKKLFRLPL